MKKANFSMLIVSAITLLTCFGCSEEWFKDEVVIPNPGGGLWQPLISANLLEAAMDCEEVVVVDVDRKSVV